MAKKLIYHLGSNDLIYANQYGFLPNHLTEQNLMQIINYVSNALNDGMYCVVVVFLDLKKVFDVCSNFNFTKKNWEKWVLTARRTLSLKVIFQAEVRKSK